MAPEIRVGWHSEGNLSGPVIEKISSEELIRGLQDEKIEVRYETVIVKDADTGEDVAVKKHYYQKVW